MHMVLEMKITLWENKPFVSQIFHNKTLFNTFFPAFVYNELKSLKQRKAKPIQKYKK